ncbi:MAG: TPR end-of-group domain-containing protein [Planctomycetota bacterium]
MYKQATGRLSVGWMSALVVGLALCPAASAKDPFPLASAVPDDVYLCALGRHNPERDFIEQYWDEIFAAVGEAGVVEDFWSMIGALMDPEAQAEVDRLKELGVKLIKGVDWGELGEKEHACALRMGKLHTGPNMVLGGPPDVLAILRGTEESAARDFDGLVAIIDTVLAEIGKASGAEEGGLKAAKETKMGAQVVSLYPPPDIGAPHYGLAIARKGDVLIITIGDKILDDALGLMAGEGVAKPLSANPRFKAAFKDLPAPEDGMTFFDVQRLLADFRVITDALFPMLEASRSGPEDRIGNALTNEAVRALHSKSLEASREGDYKQALKFTTEAHQKDPTDSLIMYNCACFSALLGEKADAVTWLEKAVEAGFYAPGKIAGDSDLDSLRDEPGYKAALAKATEKATATGFDVASVVKVLAERVMGAAGMFDYQASVAYTDAFTTREESVTALTANAAKHPIYGVFGQRPPLKNFDRYLPQETVSFSLGGGIDWVALYKYLEDSVRAIGPKGEELLGQWQGMQQSVGFDLQKDLLSLIEGGYVSVTVNQNDTPATVVMVKVTDETAAREKVTAGLDFLAKTLPELAGQIPALAPSLAMLAPRISPATHPDLEGFSNVHFGMQPTPVVCGVTDGYVMIGTSPDAAALCLATAAGKHPNVRQNEQVMREALVPEGGCHAVSLTDRRNLGTEIGQAMMGIAMGTGMMGAFIPEPTVQKVITKCAAILGKLDVRRQGLAHAPHYELLLTTGAGGQGKPHRSTVEWVPRICGGG